MPTLSRSAEHPLSGVKTDIGRTEMSAYLSFPQTSSGRIRAMRQTTMVVKRERCGDCHALEGEYHELGCDLERCPFCGGQLISCDCCYEILNIDGSPGTRVYEFGLTPEQRKQWETDLAKATEPNVINKLHELLRVTSPTYLKTERTINKVQRSIRRNAR